MDALSSFAPIPPPPLQHFIHMVETQFESKIKKIHTNNRPEFYLTQFYASNDIVHQTFCVETPQQNAMVEEVLVYP